MNSVASESEVGAIAKLKVSNDHSDWQQLRVLQILLTSDAVDVAENGEGRNVEADDAQASSGLETIPERSNETDQSSDSVPSDGHFFQHDDRSLQAELDKIRKDIQQATDDVCLAVCDPQSGWGYTKTATMGSACHCRFC